MTPIHWPLGSRIHDTYPQAIGSRILGTYLAVHWVVESTMHLFARPLASNPWHVSACPLDNRIHCTYPLPIG
jgi:hypothetical protein